MDMISRLFKSPLSASAKTEPHLDDFSTDIICRLDVAMHVVRMNTSGHLFWGKSGSEPAEKSFVEYVGEDAFKRVLAAVGTEPVEYRDVLEDLEGQKKDVLVRLFSFVPGKKDLKRGFVCIIQDISEQVRLEKELVQMKRELKRSRRYRRLGLLAGSISHDLNNILSGIATYPDVLMMDDDLDPAMLQGLAIIKDSGQTAATIVSDFLTISRGGDMAREILNMNTVVERYFHSRDFVQIQQRFPHIMIEMVTEPELLNLEGSYIHIEKTLMNLILNAVEAVTEKQDARVEIFTENRYVDERIESPCNVCPGEYVVLMVQDNGVCIQEEHINKIYEPFYARQHLGKSGAGLGLTVVWNVVQDHDGYIHFSSGPSGNRFELFFPARRKEKIQKIDGRFLDEIKGKGELILVVDGLEDQQKIAGEILQGLGYQVITADNAASAAGLIRKNKVDLVILDMALPKITGGMDIDQLMRKNNPGQKTIVASGSPASEKLALEAGGFVKKPYTVMDMGIAIKEELER